MRAALVVVVAVLAGCEQKNGGGGAEKPGKQNDPSDGLPQSTAKLRADSMDVYSSYSFRDPPPKHPHEGKRLLFKASGVCHGAKVGGKLLILEGSDNLFCRPRVVHVLKSDKGFHTGEYPGSPYIEGVLRGLVDYTSRDWAKDWLKLTPQEGLKDQFILIEDATLVSAPKG